MRRREDDLADLESWLEEAYVGAYRTACLILGNSADAEEAVQDAFLRAWRFRASLVGSDVKPWLYRVVVNTCVSRLRKEIPARQRRSPESDLTNVSTPDDISRRIAVSRDVSTALRDLPEHLRIVIVLRYYADLSEREIATAIGRRPGTVKSRLHEARSQLANHPALRPEPLFGSIGDSEAVR